MYVEEQLEASPGTQIIKQEEREIGDTGFKPYIQYLKQGKGCLYFTLGTTAQVAFILGQLAQNYWLASEVDKTTVSRVELNVVYSGIGILDALFLFLRAYFIVLLGCTTSESIFAILLRSLFRAPMSFYDSTPQGRILSRVRSFMHRTILHLQNTIY